MAVALVMCRVRILTRARLRFIRRKAPCTVHCTPLPCGRRGCPRSVTLFSQGLCFRCTFNPLPLLNRQRGVCRLQRASYPSPGTCRVLDRGALDHDYQRVLEEILLIHEYKPPLYLRHGKFDTSHDYTISVCLLREEFKIQLLVRDVTRNRLRY